jgi:mannosyltransferase OCH1-like enzyme
MTNLESLANLGEIIGAVTVVVSLIYLAVQVRQNTQAQQTENFSRALDRVASIQATLSQDPEMSVIFSKGVSDPSDLTSRERMQFTWTMYELFGAFEFMFFVSKANAIPEEIWQRWSSAVAVRPIPFSESFTSYIETVLENNPTDTESTRRYQQFLAEGRVPT